MVEIGFLILLTSIVTILLVGGKQFEISKLLPVNVQVGVHPDCNVCIEQAAVPELIPVNTLGKMILNLLVEVRAVGYLKLNL